MPFGVADTETGLPVTIEFGQMDIGMSPAYRPAGNFAALGLSWMNGPQPEGWVHFKEPKSLKELEPLVVLTFLTLKSLNKLIESLERMRPAFEQKYTPTPDYEFVLSGDTKERTTSRERFGPFIKNEATGEYRQMTDDEYEATPEGKRFFAGEDLSGQNS